MSQFKSVWFEAPDALLPSERILCLVENVALYENKQLLLEKGVLKLTNIRILWTGSTTCFMNLDRVLTHSFDAGSWTKSEKIILNTSAQTFFRLSFRGGGCNEFLAQLQSALTAKEWSHRKGRDSHGFGISGIQKKMEVQAEKTELHISSAFDDLSKLMASAKEMVALSQKLMQKSKEKNMTEDECAQFRSQLLKIGLKDNDSPVTDDEDRSLQKEIGKVLLPAVETSSGIISLTEAYCRVNRARGLKLISPEDLLGALRKMKEPVKLYKFPSGLQVVQLANLDENAWKTRIANLLEEKGCLTAAELAVSLQTSAVLALERLLYVESQALACRDDTINGLVFYPNRFLTENATL